METIPEELLIPEALSDLLNGRVISPGHITQEMLDQLKDFVDVGRPMDYMKQSVVKLTPGQPITLQDLPPEFLAAHPEIETINDYCEAALKELPPEFLETHSRISADTIAGFNTEILTQITQIANESTPDNLFQRQQYQAKILTLMTMVINSLRSGDTETGFLNQPGKNKLVLALRGAKFFEPLLKRYVSSTVETEVKRIELEESNPNLGAPFIVGVGEIKTPSAEEIENTKTLLMVDDCLSTAMTQLVLLEKMLEAGYRPENIVMLFTIATTEGIKHVYNKIEELKKKFNLPDLKFTLQCAGICYFVNKDMYLITKDGLFQVGDMGKWLEAIPDIGVPVSSAINPASAELPGDVNPGDLNLIEG